MKLRMPLVIISSVLLVSCQANQSYRSNEMKSSATVNQINQGLDDLSSGNVERNASYEEFVSQSYWVDSTPIVVQKTVAEPELEREITYISSLPLALENIAQDLGFASGIKFKLAPELSLNRSVDAESNETDAEGEVFEREQSGLGGFAAFTPNWTRATVREVLDSLATRFDLSWSFDRKSQTVSLYRYYVKQYKVHLTGETIAHDTSMTNESLVSGGAEGASVSGSAISTDVTLTTDAWSGLIASLDVIKSPGGTFSADKSSFTITVNDTEAVQSRVQTLVESINDQALKQIVFDVTLLTLTASSRALVGIDFELMYKNAVEATVPGLVGDGLSRLSHTPGDANFDGTKIFMNALSEIGKTTFVDNFKRTTLNNQIASIMISRNRPYLRSVSIPVEGSDFNNNGEASLTDLVTGFSMTLRPHLITDKEMLVSVTINRRSAPNEFERVDAGAGIFLERPDIQDDSDFQQIVINSGQTKVISGIVRSSLGNARKGVTHHDNWWLGGQQDTSEEKQMILLFVTARVI